MSFAERALASFDRPSIGVDWDPLVEADLPGPRLARWVFGEPDESDGVAAVHGELPADLCCAAADQDRHARRLITAAAR